jgi:adenylate kinase
MALGFRLVLFGPPGAGKGTQAQLLAGHLEVQPISTGNLFRSNVEQETPLGLKASSYMSQGLLVPDEVTIDIVLDTVLSINSDEGFILDGFPRNPAQAVALEEALKRRSRPLDLVVYIEVPERVTISRVTGRWVCRDCQTPYTLETSEQPDGSMDKTCERCGGELYRRNDDTPEAVKKRIEVYNGETLPVLEFYRERSLLAAVSGVGTVDDVFYRVIKEIQRVSKTRDDGVE